MPAHVLLEAVRNVDILSWPVLYELRDRFQVTITALKVRLERLGLLYVAEDGRAVSVATGIRGPDALPRMRVYLWSYT